MSCSSHPDQSKIRKTILSTVAIKLRKREYASSLKPSILFTQQGGAKKRKGHPRSVFKLYQNSKETGKPTQLKRTRCSRSFSFHFFHHIPLLTARPWREKGFAAVTVPQDNFSGTVNRVNKGNPATLSSPNTHPSFLGSESPLPCGSSMPLARAPSPRERELPPRLSNAAQ